VTQTSSSARPHDDGSAGDVDYSRFAAGYTNFRRPDARIQSAIDDALGEAVTVLNVGAGTGAYEPAHRDVTAVEPSASMRAERAAAKPAIDSTAESLPFADGSFDAGMSTMSVHQWPDLEAGLAELRRVATGPVVILTADPAHLHEFWLNDYAPEVMETEARRFPAIDRVAAALGGGSLGGATLGGATLGGATLGGGAHGGAARAWAIEVRVVEIPLDCTDGFNQAYYGRPEMFLDPGARAANSAWSFVGAEAEERFVRDLERDLDDGTWDRRHGRLRTQPTFDGSLRLVISRPS
jgi:SAM-dependent methyltransferase